jgi:uncharacterized sulfatase
MTELPRSAVGYTLAVCAFLASSTLLQAHPPGTAPNVLMIYLEDTNLDLGTYGHPIVQTPNMDRIAAAGMKFNTVYCPSAICNASRVSTMTGQRPSTTGIEQNSQTFHADQMNGVPILPKQFRDNGYFVVGSGKIFHSSYYEPGSWDESSNHSHDQWITYPQNPDPGGDSNLVYWGPYLNGPTGSLGKMRDTKHTDAIIDFLQNPTEPFFAAVGYHAPHEPLIYPERFDSLYDPVADVPALPPEESTGWQTGLDPSAYSSFNYLDPAWNSDPDQGRQMETVAYWRTITYIDDEIGRLLDELVATGLDATTIVVLFSDHGWSNGHHARFGKRTLFDVSARVPLLISVPGMLTAGQSCGQPVELIDVYPTFMDLCNLPMPSGLEGDSLSGLLQNPLASHPPAFPMTHRSNIGTVFGVRTDQYKFVWWSNELHQFYDLQADPLEYSNLFGNPTYDSLVIQHMGLLSDEGLVSCPAGWSHYGTGLAGTLGIPLLTPQSDPILGQPLQIDLSNSLGASTVGLLFVGFQQASLPAFGGTVHLVPQINVTVPVPVTGLPLSFTVPFNLSNCGFPVYMQALESDPAAPAGLSMTPGLELILGA